MKPFIVPFDFSANARVALESGLQLARATASFLTVIHVVHESPYKLAAATDETAMETLIRENEQEKTTALQDEVTRITNKLQLRFTEGQISVQASFNPLITATVIETAVRQDAGLIITGTHGASGLKKVLFGSNTANLISHSPVPVLAIPGDYSFQGIRTIMYASDLEHLETELQQLIPFAISLNAVIEVVHLDYGPDTKKVMEEVAGSVIRKLPYQFIRLLYKPASLNHSLMYQLKETAAELKADWMVMFTKEKSVWGRLFSSSHTQDMSQSLSIPLLSFRKPG